MTECLTHSPAIEATNNGLALSFAFRSDLLHHSSSLTIKDAAYPRNSVQKACNLLTVFLDFLRSASVAGIFTSILKGVC